MFMYHLAGGRIQVRSIFLGLLTFYLFALSGYGASVTVTRRALTPRNPVYARGQTTCPVLAFSLTAEEADVELCYLSLAGWGSGNEPDDVGSMTIWEDSNGNGSVDAGLSILLDKSISDKTMTYWNFGGVFAGDVRGHQTLDIEDFIYGGVAVETHINEKLSLIAQMTGQTPLYPKTDLKAIDRDSWMLAVGGRYHTGKGNLELSLTEDTNASGSPDFIVNLTYKISL